MILYPAIDLKDGQCVRLYKGAMDQATVFNQDPADQARWLDPRTADEALAELVRPWQGALTIRAVGDGVNDARHSDGAWFGEAAS